MKSDNVKKQIESAELKQRDLTAAREVLQKRVTFLTLQAESLEYPAASGDTKAQAERAALLGELSDLAGKLEANQQEAQAVQENITALQADYRAARLDEETVRRDRAALRLIECNQEIEKHQEVIKALRDSLPALEAEAARLNGIVVGMGGLRLEYAAPAGSDEIKSSFFEDIRARLVSALS